MKILEVNHLSIDFAAGKRFLPVVSDVSFSINKGEILALVGESGCGKSVSCLALTGLVTKPAGRLAGGEILFTGSDGKTADLAHFSEKQLRKIRGGGIAYIFQEPAVSLNPVLRVGDQIAEAIELHRKDIHDIRSEVISLLHQVGIPAPEKRAEAYPHELSGGMQQRVMIAMALASAPQLLIADEPTTALDVTIQAQILDLLRELREKRGMAIILVTHNLGIVAELADHVAVMYAGTIVESAPARELLDHPCHPYTRALLKAVPHLHGNSERLTTIPGQVPSPADFPKGCRFFGRCIHAEENKSLAQCCCSERPHSQEVSPNHFCSCHLLDQS